MIKKFKRNLKKLVPGIITGGADNDPAGITTYSLAGAVFGYAQLWLMILATPMLIAVQSMAVKIGLRQKEGLSKVLREHCSPWVSWVSAIIILVTNVVTIGANILAVSLALELLTGAPLKYFVLPVTIFIWYIVLFKNYKTISKFMLWMVLFFIAYIPAAFLAGPDWGEVFRSIIKPEFLSMDKTYYVAAVGLLGTTITPFLFFWQVKEELEDHKNQKTITRELKHEDMLNAPGFVFSQIVAMFIMIATGATLFKTGLGIHTAVDAANALTPIAGHWATKFFAVGILGAGFLSIPVLAISTSYVVSEAVGFKRDSLSNKIKSAKGFYAVITLSLLAGVAILIIGIQPLKALYYSQVLAGLLVPFLIALLLHLANKEKIVGDDKNGWFDNTFGGLAFVIMVMAAVLMFIA